MPFAARVTDNHICPALNPNGSPHTGGPIMPPGVPNVIIGGSPAATATNQCTCAGPPDVIQRGSSNVFINQKQAARQGDPTAHGGMIAGGCPNVIIGG
jgi:uncharacterized Zn-binding protein involved in type VI secretion